VSDTVFVVLGANYNYSDSTWWVSRVFRSRDAADAYANRLKQIVEYNEKVNKTTRPEYRTANQTQWNRWIAEAQERSNHTRDQLIALGESLEHIGGVDIDRCGWEVVETPIDGGV